MHLLLLLLIVRTPCYMNEQRRIRKLEQIYYEETIQ